MKNQSRLAGRVCAHAAEAGMMIERHTTCTTNSAPEKGKERQRKVCKKLDKQQCDANTVTATSKKDERAVHR